MAEIEAKFLLRRPDQLDDVLALLDRRGYDVEPAGTSTHIDRYFDTGDWAILRAGWAFRCRSRGKQEKLTLKSLDAGDELLEDCEVACTACGRCAMDAPGLISMENNLPVVDYDGNHATRLPIQRCPTGSIVWLDPVEGPVKGPAARKVIRKGILRDAPT